MGLAGPAKGVSFLVTTRECSPRGAERKKHVTEASLLQTARSVLRTLEGKRNSPACKMEKFGDGRDKSDSLRRGR